MQFRRTPRQPETDNRLVPLINVVFLMLIFFLLVGTIRAPDPLPIEPPRSSSENKLKANSVALALAADGRIWVNSVEMSGATAEQMRAEIVGQWADDATPRRLEIRGDRSLSVSSLKRALQLFRDINADETVLVTQR